MTRDIILLVSAALLGLTACSSDGGSSADTGAEDTVSDGVDATRACQGLSRQCHERIERSPCRAGEGCTWDAARCAGTATACAEIDASECEEQPGCAVDAGACAGAATACADRPDQTSCGGGHGCAWAPAFCHGVPRPCGDYTDRASCQPVPGCSWE